MRYFDWILAVAMGAGLAACAGDGGPDDREAGSYLAAPWIDQANATGTSRSTPDRAGPTTVTLVTGDRITLSGGRGVSITRGQGRERIRFEVTRRGDHLHAIPADAAPLIAAGLVDPRLFDVTGLVELGYDDRRDDLPVIVTGTDTAGAVALRSLSAAGAVTTRALPSVRGAAIRIAKRRAADAWAAMAGEPGRAATGQVPLLRGSTPARLWLDGKRRLFLDRSAPQIGAPAAWAAGYTGAGVLVAVLDSGIDDSHPDFAGRIAHQRSFIDGEDPDRAVDDLGHGTHVASIAAGSGAASDGLYRGIAPDATLLIGRVCNAFFCPESAILAGMEWAAASGASIVNLSLGSIDGEEIDPLEQAIGALTEQYGVLFVAAAGNFPRCGGPDARQVGSPSTADAALSVGAVGPDDELADFSCVGPRTGDAGLKPEVTAPGVAIAAARAPGTPAGDQQPVDDFYARLSGTSMATPHVSGAAALLLQEHPDWRAAELKAALMASADPTAGSTPFDQGTGRIDLARAIELTVIPRPASLSFGRATWPHDDDQPISHDIIYRNTSDSAVELSLSIEETADDPDEPGIFEVVPETIAIPPGGEASVTVVADTRLGPDGPHAAVLIAAAGGQALRTPLSVDKEVESYDLTAELVGLDGQPAPGWLVVFSVATGEGWFVDAASGSAAIRRPAGEYLVAGSMWGEGPAGEYNAQLIQPSLQLASDATIVMDARTAAPIDVTVPDPSVRRGFDVFQFARLTDSGDAVGLASIGPPVLDGSPPVDLVGHLGPAVDPTEFQTALSSFWAVPGPPDPFDLFAGSPVTYSTLFEPPPGRAPTGFVRHLQRSDLAELQVEIGAPAPGLTPSLAHQGFPTELPSALLVGLYVSLDGFRRTDYLTAEAGAWQSIFVEADEVGFVHHFLQSDPPLRPQAGQRERVSWSLGMLGPDLGFPDRGGLSQVGRLGSLLFVLDPTLYSDAPGHRSAAPFELATVRLFRDDELFDEQAGSQAVFAVPPEAARYRVELESARDPEADRSTVAHVRWTFRSAATDGDGPLPAMVVRFDPPLDRRHRAPKGRPFVIPLALSRQPGSPSVPLQLLRVDASYDRGETWQRASVVRFGEVGFAIVHHPDMRTTVSLRARAVDHEDNRVEQVILDAYRLR